MMSIHTDKNEVRPAADASAPGCGNTQANTVANEPGATPTSGGHESTSAGKRVHKDLHGKNQAKSALRTPLVAAPTTTAAVQTSSSDKNPNGQKTATASTPVSPSPIPPVAAVQGAPAGNLIAVPMSVAWQNSMLQPLKIRPLPVPQNIMIPPPIQSPQTGVLQDMDISMTPRQEFNTMGTTTSMNVPAGALLTPSTTQLPVQGGFTDAESGTLLSPLKVNVVLRPKPADGAPMSDASPVSPAVVKDMHSDPRYLSETWPYDASGSVYAMLVHSPQQLDLNFQQMLASKQLVNPLMHLQPQQEQQFLLQHPGFAIQASPMGTRMHPFCPQMTPMITSPHQIAIPQQPGLPPVFSPTASLPAINLSEIMMMGDPGLFLPQNSPTNILKHLLPPIVPQHSGLNVKDITLNELRPHFNKPMAVVAKELGVCITLMKKICRRNGLVRWPHRRIRSLVNRITSLQVIAGNSTDAEQKRFQSQIIALREELSAVIQNPNEKSRKAQADAKARSPSLRVTKDEEGDDDGEGDEHDEEEMVTAGDDACNKSGGADKISSRTSESVSHFEDNNQDGRGYHDVAMRDEEDGGRKLGVGSICDEQEPHPKKRKEFSQLQPPPPIKIPCHRDGGRLRHSSAPAPQFRSLNDIREEPVRDELPGESSDMELERPSSTTSTASSKRGSISSILCDQPRE